MGNKKLIIIGAGGFAAVVAETAILSGYEVVGFADDNKELKTKIYKNIEIISTVDNLSLGNIDKANFFIIAIGNNKIRENLFIKLKKHFRPTNLIHPLAIISDVAIINNGNIILAGTVINANSNIGFNNIINSQVLIDHDSNIANHCHITQGTIIGSNVTICDSYQTEIGQIIPSFSNFS